MVRLLFAHAPNPDLVRWCTARSREKTHHLLVSAHIPSRPLHSTPLSLLFPNRISLPGLLLPEAARGGGSDGLKLGFGQNGEFIDWTSRMATVASVVEEVLRQGIGSVGDRDQFYSQNKVVYELELHMS
jgi:hypothetical protein